MNIPRMPRFSLSCHWIVLAAALVILAGAAPADVAAVDQPIPSYYDQLRYNLTSPGARTTSIGGYANPAFYGMLPGGETWFSWTDEDSLTNWGLFLGAPHIGFGVVRSDIPTGLGETAGVNDYRFALSAGTKNATFGLGYGWSGGDEDRVGRSNLVQVGLAQRMGRYVSVGVAGNFATERSYQSGLFDLAVRPLGDQKVTVFADLELPKGIGLSDAPWSAGAMLDLGPGLQLIGRYFEDESYAFSIGYSFDILSVFGSPRFSADDERTQTVWQGRLGFPQRNIFTEAITEDRAYLAMNLKGAVTYRTYRLFDTDRHALMDVLDNLEHAKNDPKISGVALNLSGASMSTGKAWEIREKLAEIRASGKHVVVFIDNIDMTGYYLASVADRVVMDPVGMVMLPGYLMGRTYVAGTLEKIGLGFDEWRFLKYKSAGETFSRMSMSDADREQRYAIVEDVYETVRAGVTDSRNKPLDTFDQWVNETTLFTPRQALEEGVVDTLGRWDDVKDVIARLEGEKKFYMGADDLAGNRYPSLLWGEDPKVAVVYALGECAMDEGINARRLQKVFQGLAKSDGVKAVVFRVDSPGGDGMASDVVAEALRKCAEKKPVIVSQGDVAGSGGYWISMYGTKIYALPTTITGSIGVIGGWMYDTGLGEKLGQAADHVKVGDHADLGFGYRLLLMGPMIPKRNLTEDERERIMKEMRGFYDQFVEKVAKGRDMPSEEVYKIAEGHVYSGMRGQEIGLVDEIGGLYAAIGAARRAAGIGDDERVEIVELPEAPLFNLSDLLGAPRLPFGAALLEKVFAEDGGAADDEIADPEWMYMRAVMKSPGRPLHMVPPEYQIYEAPFGLVK